MECSESSFDQKRDYEVDKQPTKKAQREFADKRISEINKLLANGFHIHKAKRDVRKIVSVNLRNDHMISEAFKIIVQTITQTNIAILQKSVKYIKTQK